MKNKMFLLGVAMATLATISGCQNVQYPKDTKTGQTNLVMVLNAERVSGHGQITNTFNIDQRVCSYLTHYVDLKNAPKYYDVAWYSDDKLVIKTAYESKGAKASPHYVWTCIDGSELGVGTGKVEISANNELIGTADFVVNNKP